MALDADAGISQRLGRGDRGARTHERVEDDAFAQWQRGVDDLPEK